MDKIDLNSDFLGILDEMEHGDDCLFITGKAGTGKSTLLKYFVSNTKLKVVVLAPTGIAALNIGGQTIHSFFGLPPRPVTKEEIKPRTNQKMYKIPDVIIIDEISMVRADLMDTIDYFMRVNGRDKFKAFGGVKMIFFGDLFQLPPVIATQEEQFMLGQQYESPYFFNAKAFDFCPIRMIELREVYRQSDPYFIRLLDSVRTGSIDYDEFMELNERYIPDFPKDSEFYIILSARNAAVNEINKNRLSLLKGEEFSYLPEISGEVNTEPVDSPLKLKLGAQVMFLKNDTLRRYANGTIGRISYLDHEEIKVEVPDENGELQIVDVQRYQWDVLKYQLGEGTLDTKIVGTYKQFPLKLAWAMTIHKSQGKTFDRVIIDMRGGAFESGQTYVALSRCKTLEGIVLLNPLKSKDVLVDPRIQEFYQQCR